MPLHLYVFDPEDVNELDLDEIELVWRHRYKLCGTKEAAAEVLAIKDINEGKVDYYKGWESYLNYELITEFEGKLKGVKTAEDEGYSDEQIVNINPFKTNFKVMGRSPLLIFLCISSL